MKTTLPTIEQVKSFTPEMIAALPHWNEHDKISAGVFAKQTWMKAPPSLVFIIKKEENSVAYIGCNAHNGAITNIYAGSTYLRNLSYGEKCWVPSPMNMYGADQLHFYVTNPSRVNQFDKA